MSEICDKRTKKHTGLSMFGHRVSLRVHCFVCSDLQGTGGRRLCVTIEPALLLKGDIMVSSHGKEMTNGGPLIWVGL